MPLKNLQYKSPYEIIHYQKPSYDHLRTYGCLCFASTIKAHWDKFQPRAHACIFIGNTYGKKAYKLLDLETHKVISSRDVKFHEYYFPYDHTTTSDSNFPLPFLYFHDHPVPSSPSQHSDSSNSSPLSFPGHSSSSSSSTTDHSFPPAPPAPLVPRRSARNFQPPTYLQDYVCHLTTTTPPHPTTSHWCNLVQFFALPLQHQAHISHIISYHEPNSYKEASQDPNWVKAMQTEINALQANNTWLITDLHPGKKAISSNGCTRSN